MIIFWSVLIGYFIIGKILSNMFEDEVIRWAWPGMLCGLILFME